MMMYTGTLKPIHDHVLVTDLQTGERKTASGIVLPDDNAKTVGIRPRWAKIYAVGPEQHEVQAGEWILVKHGRWTRGVKFADENGVEIVIRKVDNDDILAVADECPNYDDTINGDAVSVQSK